MDASPFDPYYEWLGIPPEEQPASYYRLLGIRDFENSATVISNAADRLMAFLRTFQTGPHAQASQDLLNQVSHARVILLNPDSREKYDCSLRESRNPNAAQTPAQAGSTANVSGTFSAQPASFQTSTQPDQHSSTVPSTSPELPAGPELPAQPSAAPSEPAAPSLPATSVSEMPQASTPSASEPNTTDVSGIVRNDDTATEAPISTEPPAPADASPVEAEPFTGTLPPEVVNKWHQSQQAFHKYTEPARSMFQRFLSCFRYPTFVLRFCGGVFLLVGAHLLYTQYASQNGKSWLWLILGYVFLFTGIVYLLLYRTGIGRRYLRDVAWLLLVLGLFFIGEFVYMAVSAAELSIFGWCILIVKGVVALGGGIGTLWGLHSLAKQKKNEEP